MGSSIIKAFDFSLPVGSIEAYVIRVNQIPMLSFEEEVSLAKEFRDNVDLNAARKLVLSHLRFVVKIARNYVGYGLPQSDLIQEGNIGLMKAVKRFNPDLGIRLVTFAVHWIKAEIHEFVLKNWRIVKIATTKAQRKLFFKLRQLKKGLDWCSKSEIDEVAKILNVNPKTVVEMESRLGTHDESFDGYEETDGDAKSYHLAPADYLYDDNSDPAITFENQDSNDNNNEKFWLAFDSLDTRSKEILKMRWLSENKSTLTDVADSFNISAERVRQLEKKAMQKIKDKIARQSI